MAQINTRIPAMLLSAILAGVVAGTPALAYQGAQDYADNSTSTSSTMMDGMMLEGWRSNDTNKKMGVISSIQNDDQ
ncbi:MAG: hypothetical protein MN733_16025, partial [Nitrososphaera sp.]|nr:hypothetical protein [Nitrososphaera sp.]